MKTLKVTSVVWLFICVFLSIFGLSQSYGGNPSGGIAPGLLLYILTLPFGFILDSILLSIIRRIYGAEVNISLAWGMLLYACMIMAGYIQWFILWPKLVRRMKHERSPKVWGVVIIAFFAILYGLYRFYIHAFPNSI